MEVMFSDMYGMLPVDNRSLLYLETSAFVNAHPVEGSNYSISVGNNILVSFTDEIIIQIIDTLE